MNQIPQEFRRITEDKIDLIIRKHLASDTIFAKRLFQTIFEGSKLLSIDKSELGSDRNHRAESGNLLAYGQTDVEIVAQIKMPDGCVSKVAALIENKIDARQGDQQGLRYRARAEYRQSNGDWEAFKCILMGPQHYIDNAYPNGGCDADGWDYLFPLDEVAQLLKLDRAPLKDIDVVLEAIKPTNAWNKPIPSAVDFWPELTRYQRQFHPDVPIFAKPQAGARLNVWPAFYENQLRNNKREIRRKYIQLAHSGKHHISLFIKNVRYEEFLPVAKSILEPGLNIGNKGGSWQSIQIRVPEIDPCKGVDIQRDKLDSVFNAARRLYEFFLKNEAALLAIPRFK